MRGGRDRTKSEEDLGRGKKRHERESLPGTHTRSFPFPPESSQQPEKGEERPDAAMRA